MTLSWRILVDPSKDTQYWHRLCRGQCTYNNVPKMWSQRAGTVTSVKLKQQTSTKHETPSKTRGKHCSFWQRPTTVYRVPSVLTRSTLGDKIWYWSNLSILRVPCLLLWLYVHKSSNGFQGLDHLSSVTDFVHKEMVRRRTKLRSFR